MEDEFYTMEQAARILGVTSRTIANYLRDGKIRRVSKGRKNWIPKGDIDKIYGQVKNDLPPDREEFLSLSEQVADLEQAIEILKMGLGFAAPRRTRTKGEVLMLRQEFVDALAKPAWTNKELGRLADLIASVTEGDLASLQEEMQKTGWEPIVTLTRRALGWIENNPHYPGRGLDILHNRMLRARNQLMGVLQASRVVGTPLERRTARTVATSMLRETGAFDERIFKTALCRAKAAPG